MKIGLASVTLRDLTPAEIVRLVKEADLDGIEWSGDAHCPPGDEELAKEIVRQTIDSGLEVISYGSYYFAGKENGNSFDAVLKTAINLRTNTIRIWTGADWRPSDSVSEESRAKAVADIKAVAKKAATAGIDIAFEYHDNTLTDTIESTIRLLNEVDMPNVYTYWQNPGDLVETNCNNLQTLVKMGKLKNVHTFSHANYSERRPFSAAEADWKMYIQTIREANPALLIEFVKGDSAEQFLEDGKFLANLVKRT